MDKVNLDGLIQREDLDIKETKEAINTGLKDTVSVSDLNKNEFFLTNLFKPDFQRETSEWDYKKILAFIESFINQELIPSIILWRSESGKVFIIDGAHRLSSLIAWINDDYGDGQISNEFYKNSIMNEQLKIAKQTREYIDKKIRKYAEYKDALMSPNKYDEDFVKKARNLTGNGIKLQWVNGDVSRAEKSFYNINQQGAIISNIELEIIRSRKTPIAISARAIMRMGSGHKYWSNFSSDKQQFIENLAKEIYDIMFMPKLETPIKTLDLPICGKHNGSSLSLIYEFVKICYTNNNKLSDDADGNKTIECLKEVKKVLYLINTNNKSSLGLHPAIYFYSKSGTFQVSTFYAFSLFVIELDKKSKKNIFIKNRENFEKIIYNNDFLFQFINRKYRSSKKSMEHIKTFLLSILYCLDKGIEQDKVIEHLLKDKKYQYLTKASVNTTNDSNNNNFSSSDKNTIFIKEALNSAPKCSICNGYIHRNAISIDHIKRKEDGGKATIDNGQLTHPYCNTGYKH